MGALQAGLDDDVPLTPGVPAWRGLARAGLQRLRRSPRTLIVLSALLFGLTCALIGPTLDADTREQPADPGEDADLADLTLQLARADLRGLTRPAALASPGGVAAARTELARYAQRLAARRAALHVMLASVDSMAQTLESSGADAEAALLRRRAEALEQRYVRLDWRQSALCDAVAAVVDWHAEALLPAGPLPDPAERDAELRVLLERVAQAEADLRGWPSPADAP